MKELSQEVTQQKDAKEALTAVITKLTMQTQQQVDNADKHRLLSLDSLHAATSQGLVLPPRPPKIENSGLNPRAAAHLERVAAGNVTPRGGGVMSPRKVCEL